MRLLQKCQDRLDELAKISRCDSVWLWHKETLKKMKAKLMDLKIKKEVIQSANIK